jgi:4-hydroxybenzoate polyprenyltransferase
VILASENNYSNYYLLFIFLIGAISLRAAGCIINDIFDRKIDAQVERTKSRPLASGELNLRQGFLLLFLFLTIGLFIFLNLNLYSEELSALGFLLAIIYPLAKRFFPVPQLVLGICFNFGALIGYSAVTDSLPLPAFILYAGCIFWTLAYDTIYALQDISDDKKIGVNSSAIFFGKNYKQFILSFYLAFFALTLIALKLAGGNVLVSGTIFLIAIIYSIIQVKNIDINNKADCMNKFKQSAYIIGLIVFLGLVVGIN